MVGGCYGQACRARRAPVSAARARRRGESSASADERERRERERQRERLVGELRRRRTGSWGSRCRRALRSRRRAPISRRAAAGRKTASTMTSFAAPITSSPEVNRGSALACASDSVDEVDAGVQREAVRERVGRQQLTRASRGPSSCAAC